MEMVPPQAGLPKTPQAVLRSVSGSKPTYAPEQPAALPPPSGMPSPVQRSPPRTPVTPPTQSPSTISRGAKQDPDAPVAQNGTGVENMKRLILDGLLRVGVFNQKLEVEWKNLKVIADVDPVTEQTVMKQLAISDEAGGNNAAFQISDIVGISQGVTANIMDKPPPADRVVAFQFLDGTLCILFEDPGTCSLALKALKQICQVPVYTV